MGFLSLAEDKVPVVLEEEGVKATFYLKRVLSKLDINSAFFEALEALQNITINRPKEETAENEEEPKPQPITLNLLLGMASGQTAVLKRALVGWDLVYPKGHPEEGQPIEFSPELVDSLSESTVDALTEELRRLNRTLTKEQVRDLGLGYSPPSSTESDSQKN